MAYQAPVTEPYFREPFEGDIYDDPFAVLGLYPDNRLTMFGLILFL